MSLRRIWPASIGLLLVLTAAVAAQETTKASPQTPQGIQRRARPGGMRRKRARLRGQENRLPQLNLSEDQKQQRHAIMERHMSALKTQRDQLFQLRQRKLEGNLTAQDRERAIQIRQELRSAMQGVRGELRNTLNADQRAQIETMRAQRRQQREEFMKQRQEFRRTPPQE